MSALRPAFVLRSVLSLAAVATLPAAAFAQGGGGMTPLSLDLAKVPVGSWAEYNLTTNDMRGKLRWALVDKTAAGIGVEMSMEGGITAMIGGRKTTTRMLLDPQPHKAKNPVKRLILQQGDDEPVELPADNPIVQAQKFARPDPKSLVKKETIKVPGGTFDASHYRQERGEMTIEYWLSDTAPPLGMVRMVSTPKNPAMGPKVTMELASKGSDAKPMLTKAPKGAPAGATGEPAKPAKK